MHVLFPLTGTVFLPSGYLSVLFVTTSRRHILLFFPLVIPSLAIITLPCNSFFVEAPHPPCLATCQTCRRAQGLSVNMSVHTTCARTHVLPELFCSGPSGRVSHRGKYQVTQDGGRCLSPPFLAAGEARLSLHSYSGSRNSEK